MVDGPEFNRNQTFNRRELRKLRGREIRSAVARPMADRIPKADWKAEILG
jgi:hypothetical protein